jgi:hypothetical protein
MAIRRRTDDTMAIRRRTDNTMAKEKEQKPQKFGRQNTTQKI